MSGRVGHCRDIELATYAPAAQRVARWSARHYVQREARRSFERAPERVDQKAFEFRRESHRRIERLDRDLDYP
jgi:hypothetical protein